MWNPDLYQQTLDFAGRAHNDQKIPGKRSSYVVHLANVCNEVLAAWVNTPEPDWDINLAMQCAILHDVVEDTDTSVSKVIETFSGKVAAGVSALTKNESLPKQEQMLDSLNRILQQPKEVRIVKMADRTVNLSAPPHYWKSNKIRAYREEGQLILKMLGGVCPAIEQRLAERIENYKQYI